MKSNSQYSVHSKTFYSDLFSIPKCLKIDKILGEGEWMLWINRDRFSWEFKGVMILSWKITFFVIDPYEIFNVAGTSYEEVKLDFNRF